MDSTNHTTYYVIRANKKLGLYLGFAHKANLHNSQITQVAQNSIDCAFYFEDGKEARRFLNAYLEANKNNINPRNIQYYQPILMMVNNNRNLVDLELDGFTCKFDLDQYNLWIDNPGSFNISYKFGGN